MGFVIDAPLRSKAVKSYISEVSLCDVALLLLDFRRKIDGFGEKSEVGPFSVNKFLGRK